MNKIYKVLCFFMTIMMSVGFISEDTRGEEPIVIEGKLNSNLSTNGEEMLDNLCKATMEITNISFDDRKGEIIGIIDNTLEFDISLELRKAKTINDTIIGTGKDRKNNFDLMSVRLYEAPTADRLYLYNELVDQETMQILLMKKSSRQLYIFEVPISDLNLVKDIDFNISNTVSDISTELWFINVFTPGEETPYDLKPAHIEHTFIYYDGPNNVYRYRIDVQAFLTATGYAPSQDTANDLGGLKVLSQSYHYNGMEIDEELLEINDCIGTMYLSGGSNIGTVSDTNKDVILSGQWGTTSTETVGGLSIEPVLSFGYRNLNLITWTPAQVITDNVEGFQTVPLTDNLVSYSVPFRRPISKSKIDQYSMELTKANLTHTNNPEEQYSQIVFAFNIGFKGVHNKIRENRFELSCSADYFEAVPKPTETEIPEV